jgi:hypothetical protein
MRRNGILDFPGRSGASLWCIAILQAAHGSKGIFLLVEGKDNIHIVVLSIESKRKACIT